MTKAKRLQTALDNAFMLGFGPKTKMISLIMISLIIYYFLTLLTMSQLNAV